MSTHRKNWNNPIFTVIKKFKDILPKAFDYDSFKWLILYESYNMTHTMSNALDTTVVTPKADVLASQLNPAHDFGFLQKSDEIFNDGQDG